jgi:hypothetical protein
MRLRNLTPLCGIKSTDKAGACRPDAGHIRDMTMPVMDDVYPSQRPETLGIMPVLANSALYLADMRWRGPRENVRFPVHESQSRRSVCRPGHASGRVRSPRTGHYVAPLFARLFDRGQTNSLTRGRLSKAVRALGSPPLQVGDSVVASERGEDHRTGDAWGASPDKGRDPGARVRSTGR